MVAMEETGEGKICYHYCADIPIGTCIAHFWNKEVARECGDVVDEEMELFYSDADSQTNAVYDICGYFHIERISAYKKKNRALQKLVTPLYGKS